MGYTIVEDSPGKPQQVPPNSPYTKPNAPSRWVTEHKGCHTIINGVFFHDFAGLAERGDRPILQRPSSCLADKVLELDFGTVLEQGKAHDELQELKAKLAKLCNESTNKVRLEKSAIGDQQDVVLADISGDTSVGTSVGQPEKEYSRRRDAIIADASLRELPVTPLTRLAELVRKLPQCHASVAALQLVEKLVAEEAGREQESMIEQERINTSTHFHPRIFALRNVLSVPTTLFFRKGDVVPTVVKNWYKENRDLIELAKRSALSSDTPHVSPPSPSFPDGRSITYLGTERTADCRSSPRQPVSAPPSERTFCQGTSRFRVDEPPASRSSGGPSSSPLSTGSSEESEDKRFQKITSKIRARRAPSDDEIRDAYVTDDSGDVREAFVPKSSLASIDGQHPLLGNEADRGNKCHILEKVDPRCDDSGSEDEDDAAPGQARESRLKILAARRKAKMERRRRTATMRLKAHGQKAEDDAEMVPCQRLGNGKHVSWDYAVGKLPRRG
ncbi:hypothetical protein H2199_002168 [Coniosporium tulheliwenetii]|uniref:Uncharacterized protein n=1 Tax=Coniosporium tulheliwenetii TaxID=3383036 RepID=A0ACC2ZI14_9PEZI|nr:hypothetical protein H2199_002168 [Cladosporium sp. JES 115]